MPAYEVRIAKTAQKELAALDKKTARRLVGAIGALADAPRPTGSVKLKGEESLYRIRVGDYRVIYSLQRGVLTVLILRVRHRRDVYRGLG